jgi:putative glutamine amidotransferase
MAERPVIGVTGAHGRFSPSWWCTRFALWLAGGQALRISIKQPGVPEKVQGIIIGGGDDIDPALYGGEGPARNAQRDELEVRYIRFALEKEIPLLGICRGAQLLNAVLGGNLYSSIRHLRKNTSNRRTVLPAKIVQLEPGSMLAEITGRTTLKVNSLHFQAILRPAKTLRVVGRDLDNLTQAVEAQPRAALMGVQWHPEYIFYLPSQFVLFRWLVKASRDSSSAASISSLKRAAEEKP